MPSTIKPIFTHNPLNRQDAKRSGFSLQNERQKLLNCKYLLLHKGQVVAIAERGEQGYFLVAKDLPSSVFEQPLWVYLGELDSIDYVAIGVNSELLAELEVAELDKRGFVVTHIRQVVLDGLLSDELLAIVAEGNSLLSWHLNHGFCAKCGAKSQLAHGGWRRDCGACGAQHFPRTDPVVIMLVTHQNQCLLGRGVNFAQRRFSCLAGFMEPGETIAQAARRELFEEAGIIGGEVEFLFDQPWPFPSNLMIGVKVEALSTEITIDENELAEAMWVSKDEVARILTGARDGVFDLPPRVAIARNLLEYWVATEGEK